MKNIKYLDEETIIKINKEAIKLWNVKKADKHEVLSYSKLRVVIENHENSNFSFLDTCVNLLVGITKAHVFASGNRRTAIMAILTFADLNKLCYPKTISLR